MIRKYRRSWDKQEFLQYLILDCGLSNRSAGNYVSRCCRVERILNIDLIEYTNNSKKYLELLKKINTYVYEISKIPRQRYALGATMRLAVKKFAEFNEGSDFTSKINGYTAKIVNK
jgi:hypothetical protein